MLRLPIGLISCGAMLVAQLSPGFAQSPPPAAAAAQPAAFSPAEDATPSPAMLEAFAAFPKGGDQLSKRIEDLIVSDPKLAPALVNHVQTTPSLNKDQRMAAFRGLAAALNRLGIKAADMPIYKAPAAAPVVAPPVEYGFLAPLLGAALIGGLICIGLCGNNENPPIIPVSP